MIEKIMFGFAYVLLGIVALAATSLFISIIVSSIISMWK